jgi:hypothetical protein
MVYRWDLEGATKSSWMGLRLPSGREHPRYLRAVLEPAYKKLLALFVGKSLSVTLGLIEVSERFPPQTPVLTILK